MNPSFAHRLRKRGFTLMETVLVIAVGLGLLIGGIIFYQQAQASSDQTDKTRAAVALSSEVRAQFRTRAAFNSGTPALNAANIMAQSSLPDSMFNNTTIAAASASQFRIVFTDLPPKVCSRMAANPGDLGSGPPTATCPADPGTTLTVTYNR